MRKLLSGSGLLALALLLGALTAAGAMAWLTTLGQAGTLGPGDQQQTRPVVVAKAALSSGTRVTAEMVEVRQIPQSAVLQGAATAAEDTVGRVVRYPLAPGEQVSQGKLVPEIAKDGAGLAFSVPSGMRAVAVSITEISGAGGLIVPGDRVDVMVHTEYERLFGPTDARTIARDEKRHPAVLTVLQDLLVLAVGQQTTPATDTERDAATLRPEDAKPQPSAKSVTLAVSPAQSQMLFLAAHEGALGLSLRPFGETNTATLAPLVRLESPGAVLASAIPAVTPTPAPQASPVPATTRN